MLLPFGQFQTIVPLAAWLAPIFLLRFSRTQRALIALPVLALVWGIVFLIMWLAPVTNEVWERGFQWATLRSSVIH
jgi:hypothetical protein